MLPGDALQMSHHRLTNAAPEVTGQDKHRVNSPCCNIEHAACHGLIADLCEVKVLRQWFLETAVG